MKVSQNNYIIEKIKNTNNCSLKEPYVKNIDMITTTVIKNILNQKYINNTDVKALLCLFNVLITYAKNTKINEKNIMTLNRNILDWVTNMNIIDVHSNYGIAYFTTILSDINIIIKIPLININSFYREYFIGVNAINNLRYYIPTFSCIFGLFKCSKPNKENPLSNICSSTNKKYVFPYIIYERASGPSITDFITEPTTTFRDILEIFVQVLLSLEIAQREYNFTHFDLHSDNVMSKIYNKLEPPLEYDVSINNYTYRIKTHVLPIIIDYGASSVKIENNTFGEYQSYGIINHIVPGFDMYRFLVYILYIITHYRKPKDINFISKISELFKFYGNDDVYNIFSNGDKKAINEYCRKITTTQLATYTPNMFLEWILDPNKEYLNILGDSITKRERNVSIPLHYSILENEYNKIFSNSFENGETQAINIIKNCSNFKIENNYILNKYNIYVLEGFNKKFNSLEIKKSIDEQKRIIENSQIKRILKNNDMNTVNNFDKTIPNIDTSLIISLVNKLYSIPNELSIVTKKQLKSINNYISDTDPILNIKIKITPYLQFLYTVKELNLENEEPYKRWIDDFTNSNSYILYIDNITNIDRILRWRETLSEHIKPRIYTI